MLMFIYSYLISFFVNVLFLYLFLCYFPLHLFIPFDWYISLFNLDFLINFLSISLLILFIDVFTSVVSWLLLLPLLVSPSPFISLMYFCLIFTCLNAFKALHSMRLLDRRRIGNILPPSRTRRYEKSYKFKVQRVAVVRDSFGVVSRPQEMLST